MIRKTLVIALVLLESYLIAEGQLEQSAVQGYYGFPVASQARSEEWSLETCEVKITKVGCYKDDLHTPRPLPRLIITDRDTNSPASDGHTFDWENPAKSMRSLACRCAKKVLKMGYSHFSLQFYGECWSGKNAEATFSDDGPSKECVDGGFKPCDQRPNVPCAGEGRTNFVYIATEKPALPTTQGPRCVDKYDICRHYASIGLCNDEYPLVLEYCVKSCGRC